MPKVRLPQTEVPVRVYIDDHTQRYTLDDVVMDLRWSDSDPLRRNLRLAVESWFALRCNKGVIEFYKSLRMFSVELPATQFDERKYRQWLQQRAECHAVEIAGDVLRARRRGLSAQSIMDLQRRQETHERMLDECISYTVPQMSPNVYGLSFHMRGTSVDGEQLRRMAAAPNEEVMRRVAERSSTALAEQLEQEFLSAFPNSTPTMPKGGFTMEAIVQLREEIASHRIPGRGDFGPMSNPFVTVLSSPLPEDWPGIYALFMSLAFFADLPGHVRGYYLHEEAATPSKVVEHDDSGHAAHVRFASIREEIT